MQVSDFDYELPEALIAQYPLAERTASRLLVLHKETGSVEDKYFKDLLAYLQAGDLLVFNQSKVIKARLFGQKLTGGKVELLIERVLQGGEALAHIRSSKSPKPGAIVRVADAFDVKVIAKEDALFRLCLISGEARANSDAPTPTYSSEEKFSQQDWFDLLDKHGHMPLPPYMHRDDEASDMDRYQTVYAKEEGSVAAPTAGLHFDEMILAALKAKGINFGHVTLHVGAGTFQPVRVDAIENHHMHSEWINVPPELCQTIQETKLRGKRVIAVGTTTVRSLETAALSGELHAFQGETDIFIYPGKPFRVIDGMITNFHLPRSTLLMLVSAFSGQENILKAYRHAVEQQYRFFSYGDAMLLL